MISDEDFLRLFNVAMALAKPVGKATLQAESIDVRFQDIEVDSLDLLIIGMYLCDAFAVSEEKETLPEAAMQPAGDTEAAVLVRARKGQGLFRARVANYSSKCRVTGVAEPSLLRASHIKPWSKCESNEERLDGANGLLLSPHVDLLFDKGLLTFRPTGQLEISEVLPKYVVEAWNITRAVDSTPFKPRQAEYLKFHNDVVYPLGKERWNRG